jgi:hypothetical protein
VGRASSLSNAIAHFYQAVGDIPHKIDVVFDCQDGTTGTCDATHDLAEAVQLGMAQTSARLIEAYEGWPGHNRARNLDCSARPKRKTADRLATDRRWQTSQIASRTDALKVTAR